MNKAVALTLVLVLTATLCLILPVQVNATSRTIVVPDDYPTISAAIGNATTGDTVCVKSGIYQESLQITTALSLIGENRDTTIIESPDNSKSVVTINHNNVTIAGFTVQNALGLTSIGIDLWAGISFCNITKNKITKNTDGIRLISSPYNSITGNMVDSNSAIGIFLYGSSSNLLGSDYNVIQGNEILYNGEGLVLRLACNHNDITRNAIGNSPGEGIFLNWADNNRFEENNLTSNGVGVRDAGSNNTFFHNNFFSNTQQTNSTWFEEGSGQFVVSEGNWTENYWSDYTGKDINGDGRGDTPYIIDEKNQDNNPLVNPFGPSSLLPQLQPITNNSTTPSSPSAHPIVSLLSPANTSYGAIYNTVANIPFIYWTNASLSWVGYSLDGGSNVTASNGTLVEIPVGSRSLTVYANDSAGNWAVPQTVFYSVAWNGGAPHNAPPEPFPWLPLAAVTVTVVVVIAAAVLVYWKKRKR